MKMLNKLLNKARIAKWVYRNKFWIKGNFDENSIDIEGEVKFNGINSISFWPKSSNNNISIGKNFTANNLKIVFRSRDSKLIIGDDVTLSGHLLLFGNARTIKIGNNTTALGVYILSRDADVTIGDNCLFSREIEIRSTDVHEIYDLDTKEHLNPAKEVVINDKVWVGAKVFISKGAVIPDGSIVGAASFVNKPFTEKNVIIAGSPAKIVKRNVFWKR